MKYNLDEGFERSRLKMNYREFLLTKINFKKVFEIPNRHIINKIHFGFRLNYIVDNVFDPIVDEGRSLPLYRVFLKKKKNDLLFDSFNFT